MQKIRCQLIEVNQPVSYNPEKFIDNVLEQIKEQTKNKYPYINFNIPKGQFQFKEITFDKILPNVKAFFNYLQNDSPIKGYSCINTNFQTYEDKITMCCPEGHHFETTVAEFKRNAEGKKGRSIPCIVCYSKENVLATKIDLEFCRKEGKKHGLELLSKEYKNVNEELEWKNENGEVFMLSFRKIQRRKLEKKGYNKGVNLEYCKDEGQKYGLKLLSTDYKNVNEKMKWEKTCGEVIELSLRQIQRSKTKVF